MPIFSQQPKNQPKEDLPFFKEAMIFIWEIFKVIVVSLAIILPIRYFLIQPFYVKGASMEPNFLDREYLIIDEISYRFRAAIRGEVVVFRYPLNPKEYFIKRVIGLPNEKLVIANNTITIYNEQYPDGLLLKEFYLESGEEMKGDKVINLKGDEYYLLGDNRSESLDSRFFGPVMKSFITGRVLFRGWPLNRVGVFTASPEYN